MYLEEKVNEASVHFIDCRLGVGTVEHMCVWCPPFTVFAKSLDCGIALEVKLPFNKILTMLQKVGPHGQSPKDTNLILRTLQKRVLNYQGVICLYFHGNSFIHWINIYWLLIMWLLVKLMEIIWSHYWHTS